MTLLSSGWRPWWLDLRSLAASRILLALCVLADVALRWPLARVFYSDDGLLPRQAALGSSVVWSPFFVSGSVLWAGALFAVTGVLALGLLVGWRGRLCAGLLALLTTGVHLRNPYVNNAGDVLLSVGLAWLALLPVTACWSLDRAAHRSPGARALLSGVYRAPAALGLTVQLGVTYLLNHFYKTDPVWLGGQAVTQVLTRHLYSRDHLAALAASLPAPLLTPLARSVWWLEFGAAFLLLVPSQFVRVLVVVALIGMHLGFAALLSIGMFPFVCVSLLVSLLPALVWPGRAEAAYVYRQGSRRGYALALVRRSLAGNERAKVRPGAGPSRSGWWSALSGGPFLWPLLVPAALVLAGRALLARPGRGLLRFRRVRWGRAWLGRRCWALLQGARPGRLLPGRREWVLGALLTLGVPLYNVADYWQLVPAGVSSAAFSAGLGQKWALFAPSPRYLDGYFLIRGHGDHGAEYDLFRRLVLHRPDLPGSHVVMGDALGAGFLGFRSEIMRKFFEASVNQPGAGALRASVRDALCSGARLAGHPVRLVSFTFMQYQGAGDRTVPRQTAVLACRAVLVATPARHAD